jgi:hypothetical protein
MKYSSKRTAFIATVIIFILALFVIGSLTLGWTGIREEVTLEAGACKETYINEIAPHPLKDLYYCEDGKYYDDEIQNCGMDLLHHPELAKRAAQRDFLTCLCASPADYSSEIIENYSEIRADLSIPKPHNKSMINMGTELEITTDPAVACEQLALSDWPNNDY